MAQNVGCDLRGWGGGGHTLHTPRKREGGMVHTAHCTPIDAGKGNDRCSTRPLRLTPYAEPAALHPLLARPIDIRGVLLCTCALCSGTSCR